ncbi:MAG: hypothetical protein AAF035_06670 [Pseudomonadota bacterium]
MRVSPSAPWLSFRGGYAVRIGREKWLALFCSLIAAAPLATLATFAQTANSEETELTDDEKALDEALLGVWSLVKVPNGASISESALRDAVRGCVTAVRLGQIQVQDGAATTPPNQDVLRGSLIYWRTDAGVQKLDIPNRQVFVFGEYEKRAQTNGADIHVLRGKNVAVAIRFGRPAKAQLMLENQRVFLKCPPLPKPAGASE